MYIDCPVTQSYHEETKFIATAAVKSQMRTVKLIATLAVSALQL